MKELICFSLKIEVNVLLFYSFAKLLHNLELQVKSDGLVIRARSSLPEDICQGRGNIRLIFDLLLFNNFSMMIPST